MSILRAYYATKIGLTNTISVGAVASSATPIVVNANNQALPPRTPHLVILLATTDCHLTQGDAAVSAPTTSSFKLLANVYMPVLVESADDLYIRVIRNSADGTLYHTNAVEVP